MDDLSWLDRLLQGWPNDEPEYHLILAQLFFILATREQSRAQELQRRRT
jgi:hypothetical protein